MDELMYRARSHLGGRLRDPVLWNDVTQLVKTVAAAVLAWVLAAGLLGLPQSFLAPWSALLVVHATVFRSMSRGVRQIVATVVAVVLAAAVGQTLGLEPLGLGVLLTLAMLVGWMPWFGPEAITITTTALIVLTTGWSEDSLLIARLVDTAVGVGVGLVVNAVVWPPLRRHTAVAAMSHLDDGLGQLLQDLGRRLGSGSAAGEVENWVERSRKLDEGVDEAWALVRQAQEAARLNPRRSARELREPRLWFDRLHRREQVIAEVRSMARTLGSRMPAEAPWADPFGRVWSGLLVDAGRALAAADADAVVEVRGRLEQLVRDTGDRGDSERWPVHGALVVNLRNILDAVDTVVAAMPKRA